MSRGSLVDTVVAFLDQEQWPYEIGTSGVVHARYQGDEIDVDCFVQAFEPEAQLIVICVLGVTDEGRRRAAAELASRINVLLRIGSFEVDFDDGELRHRVGLLVPSSGADIALVGTAILHSVLAADRYASAFVAVDRNDADPATALDNLRSAVLRD